MTEPCDATVGGATWLDQAQETAARTNQNAGPHRRKVGQQRAAPISQGGGVHTGEERQQTAADPHRKGMGPENCPPIAKKCPHRFQRGRGDARRGMGLQTARAEAKRTAITSFRSISNLVSSTGRALTLRASLPLRPSMLKMYHMCS